MSKAERFSQFIKNHYEIHEWRHATAILEQDFPNEWGDLCSVLETFRFKKSQIAKGGGSKTDMSAYIDSFLYERGWTEKHFDTQFLVDENVMNSPTHKVDCYKNMVAVEIEWNNKDPFYDRDLNNFRLLFDLRAISVGIIITRADELQDIFTAIGRKTSFGASTTHMSKLLPRIEGGGGGGCPILAFGITKRLYLEHE